MSKVKVKGQAFSLYVGEGGHKCYTNIYITVKILQMCQNQGSNSHELCKMFTFLLGLIENILFSSVYRTIISLTKYIF